MVRLFCGLPGWGLLRVFPLIDLFWVLMVVGSPISGCFLGVLLVVSHFWDLSGRGLFWGLPGGGSFGGVFLGSSLWWVCFRSSW